MYVHVSVCEQSKPALYAFTRDAVSTPRKPGGSRTSQPHTHLNKTSIFRRCHRSPIVRSVRTCRNIDRQCVFRRSEWFVRENILSNGIIFIIDTWRITRELMMIIFILFYTIRHCILIMAMSNNNVLIPTIKIRYIR